MLGQLGHVDKTGLEPVIVELESANAFPEFFILLEETFDLFLNVLGDG